MQNSRSSVVHWLWTNNPFYAISALLMLYAVRASYGELEIGAINCWVMLGVLAVYTSVLAAVGVAIVRWGQVWEDARSIFLILLLMFLAVSVAADDLFVKMESSTGAVALLACGLAFAMAVFHCVLRGSGIRLGWAFQLPFVLFLALFYVTPWWCSPELHPTNAFTLDWTVFLFSQAAALLCLTLLPAVRRGRDYVANNGTPWAWPWFPWIAFGVIGGAVILRSYALSLTFSQTGPIWVSSENRQGIVLDTIWRPYFVVPFAMAVMLLVLEAGLVSGNRRLVQRVMRSTMLLLPMAWPWWADTPAGGAFIERMTQSIGSPVWLTVWMLVAFYGGAFVRRVPQAELGLLASTLMLSCIGPQTISVSTFVLQPIPLFVVGMILVVAGLLRHSSVITLAATIVMTCGLWVILPQSLLASFRATACYHVLLCSCLVLSICHADRLALMLRHLGAAWIPLSALFVMTAPAAAELALHWRLLYVTGLASVCLVCARVSRSRAYWTGFVGTTTILGYSLAASGFRQAGSVVGRNAMAAFSWSVGTLLIGALISAYKACWLPPITIPGWIGGTGVGRASSDPPHVVEPMQASDDSGA